MPYYTGLFGNKSSESFQNQSFVGEVVQIFDHTLNVVLKKQFPNLLTIGGLQVLASPQSIAITSFAQFKAQIQVGDRCVIQDGERLVFEKVTCSLQEVVENPLPMTVKRLDEASLLRKQIDLESFLQERKHHQSQKGIAPFYQQLQKESSQLEEALVLNDSLQMKRQVQRILGLGVGLTPSGDDMLTGMLLVLRDHQAFKEMVVQELKKTNHISQHQLYFASLGMAKPSVLAVIRGLFCPEKSEVFKQAIEETLAIGSTSGHDLLTGVVVGLQVLKRKGEENNELSGKNNSQSLH